MLSITFLLKSRPPEFQLVLLVGTTALLCKTKNDKKLELESFLNEPIKKEM